MRWLYRLQARLGLTDLEGAAALALLLSVVGGTVALQAQASSSPIPADFYAASDAAFETARARADSASRSAAAADSASTPGPPARGAAPTVDAPTDSTAAEVARSAVERAAAPRRSASLPPVRTNINTASAAELERLPGIGPALAGRIVEHRTRSPFRSPDEIVGVRGIGEKTLEKLRPWIFI